MASNRTGHTASLVSDPSEEELVLFVAGGGSACNRELYRLGDGSTPIEFEDVCRIDHTATVLEGGALLIAGGQDSLQMTSETLGSAEIYSPVTNSFAFTGSLHTPRYGHTAVLLSDGNVLITGGYVTDEFERKTPIASAELYEPTHGAFTSLSDLSFPRADHTMTLLKDGSVLVIGGTAGGSPIERYVPSLRAFVTVAGTDLVRSEHTTNRLEDGTVLIAGGTGLSGAALADALLFDPLSEQFEPTGLLSVGRAGHTSTMLPDGSVLLIGGNGADHWALSSIEVYDPDFRQFSVIGHLLRARVSHTATYLSSEDGVLVAGGWGPLYITGPVIMRDVELVKIGSER